MNRGVESLGRFLTANKMLFDLPTNECKSNVEPGMTSLNGVRKRRQHNNKIKENYKAVFVILSY